jgi:hypothetical protein
VTVTNETINQRGRHHPIAETSPHPRSFVAGDDRRGMFVPEGQGVE